MNNNCDSSDLTNKGTLFLYTEVGGYRNPDFGGFPDSCVVSKKFNKIAAIANTAATNYNQHWEDVEKYYTGIAIERWVSIYFGPDAIFPLCLVNHKPCKPDNSKNIVKDPVNEVVSWITEKYINNNDKIKGIIFDDEVGDPTNIVAALDIIKKNYNIKLAYTKSVGSAKQYNSPRGIDDKNKDKDKRVIWDYMLGQAYTDTGTKQYYKNSCEFADSNFWSKIINNLYLNPLTANLDNKIHPVPLFCGGGDCQQVPEKGDGSSNTCYDERMTGKQITELLNYKPDDKLLADFGVWWGTFPGAKSFCGTTSCSSNTSCTTDKNCDPDNNCYCIPDSNGNLKCLKTKCCKISIDKVKSCEKDCCNNWVWETETLPKQISGDNSECTKSKLGLGCPCNHKGDCESNYCISRCATEPDKPSEPDKPDKPDKPSEPVKPSGHSNIYKYILWSCIVLSILIAIGIIIRKIIL
jgi:hypothetical protein